MRRSLTPFMCFLLMLGSTLGQMKAADAINFEKQILPILDQACFKCHSGRAKKPKGGVRLDDVAAIRAKSRTDNLIFPRKPEKSTLIDVISLPAGDEDLMPPPDEGKPLSGEQIALIKKWITDGADFGHWKSVERREDEVSVVEVEPIDAQDTKYLAWRIDDLIEENLTRMGQQPNAPLSDDLWCRRVYLDLIGRIPTYDEINGFLQSSDSEKRRHLVDDLLASNGHVSTMFNYWCDVLRARNELADNVRGDFYLHYVKDSIRQNKPFDVWVREMVSPEGHFASSPAGGYYLRDLGNRFASVDNTATIFLGTNIGCAQCHDHPYDEWSRKAYHQFAAWTSAIETKRLNDGMSGRMSEGELETVRLKLEKEAEKRTSSPRRALERTMALNIFQGLANKMTRNRTPDFAVDNGTTAHGKLPDDYRYPDGQPNQPIQPAVLFGEATEEAGERPADTFARWLTAPDNKRFSLSIANRMWTRLMGAPFSGTLQSVRDPEDCQNPDLARFLTRLMVAVKFDLRAFQRIIANTKTYAREAGTLESPGGAYAFPGPLLRRMTAEQVWDSMMTLAVPDLDAKINFAPPDTSDESRLADITGSDDILEMVKTDAKDQAYGRLRAMRSHRQEKKDPYLPSPEFSRDGLLRASELPQPAPESHFLRVFGQSNREVADGGWQEGTVPQTLLMLNSSLFDLVAQKGSPLYETLRRQSGDTSRLRAVYLAVLGRAPTIDEMRIISSSMNGTGNTEAIAHTLLGTRQFLFIR